MSGIWSSRDGRSGVLRAAANAIDLGLPALVARLQLVVIGIARTGDCVRRRRHESDEDVPFVVELRDGGPGVMVRRWRA